MIKMRGMPFIEPQTIVLFKSGSMHAWLSKWNVRTYVFCKLYFRRNLRERNFCKIKTMNGQADFNLTLPKIFLFLFEDLHQFERECFFWENCLFENGKEDELQFSWLHFRKSRAISSSASENPKRLSHLNHTVVLCSSTFCTPLAP